MTTVTKVYTFTNGTKADATEVNKDFDDLYAQVNAQSADVAQRAINVKSAPYNATGGGVADDTAAVQAAINACSALGGGTVVFPRGTYRVSLLQVPDNVSLMGVGASTILKNSFTNTNWKHVVNCGSGSYSSKNITISNMTIDGNYPSGVFDPTLQQSHGIAIQEGSVNISVINVTLQNTSGDGVWIADNVIVGNNYPQNIKVSLCTFSVNSRQNISVVHGLDIIITNNKGDGTLDIEPEAVINKVTVTSNDFNVINATNKTGRADFTITGNTFNRGQLWDARYITFTGNTCKYLKITGLHNSVLSGNNFQSLECYPAVGTTNSYLSIIGNNFQNITEGSTAPIQCVSENASIVFWKTSNSIFSDNVISSEIAAIFCIDSNDKLKIKNNTIIYSPAVISPPATAPNGLEFQNTSSFCDISANHFEGWFTAIKSDGSTGISYANISDNIFYLCTGGALTVNIRITATECLVRNNQFLSTSEGMTMGYGSNSRVFDNYFKGTGTLLHLNNGTYQVRNNFNLAKTAIIDYFGSTITYMDDSQTTNATPVSAITPSFIGQSILDTVNIKWWKSTGLTNTSWVALN